VLEPSVLSPQHADCSLDGNVQTPCTDEFLVSICVEFCKTHSHPLIANVRHSEQAEQDRRLTFLAQEVKRLVFHPQLFPSEVSRIRFLNFLAADSRFQLGEAVSSLLIQNEIQTIQDTWRRNVSRKNYLEGSRGWENFLLFDAPGLDFTSERTTPKSTVQVLPPVASRIVGDFEREEREIVRFVEQVRKICPPFDLGLSVKTNSCRTTPR
jgi:hypothetical protein